jgi:hypothetical protein
MLWPLGTFCGYWVHFVAVWYILWPLGTFVGRLVRFPRLVTLQQEKSGNPGVSTCAPLTCLLRAPVRQPRQVQVKHLS